MLAIVIFVALALRVISLLHAGSFWFDETFTLYFARLPVHQMWQYLQFENNPPLHFFLAHFLVRLFGERETLLRLTSVVASVSTIPVIYRLGRKLHSRQSGLLAAALFAVSGLSIFNAVEFRMYPLLTLLSGLSLYFFIECFENKNRFSFLWLTIINIALVLTHLTGLSIVVLEMAYWCWRRPAIHWRFIIWQLIPLAALLVWALPSFLTRSIYDVPNAWYFGEAFNPFFFLEQCFSFLIYPTLAGFPSGLVMLTGLGLFLLAGRSLGEIIYTKEEKRIIFRPSPLLFPDILLLLALAPVIIGAVLNVQIPKQYSVSLVPFVLLLAVGSVELVKNKKLQWSIIFAALAAMIAMNYPALWRPPYTLDKLVQAINQEEVPHAKILAAAHIYTLPLALYYHGRLPVIPIYMGADSGVDLMRLVRHNWHINYYSKEDLDRFLERESKNYTTMLVVGTTHWQNEGDIVRQWFMNHGWRLAKTYSWEGYFNPDLHIFQKITK